jgi:prepilin-type processing-associated H-X9-DG protein
MTVTYTESYTSLNGASRHVTHALCDYGANNENETGVVMPMGRNQVRISGITDGTSHTLLLADKRLNVGRLGQTQSDDNEGYADGWDHDVVRYARRDYPPAPDFSDPDPTVYGGGRFGGSHPGKFNAVFGDGSGRSIPYSIDPVVFEWLGNRSDGQTVPDDS